MTLPKMTGQSVDSKAVRPKATHYGQVELLPGITFECAVLEDGRRGFIQRQMVQSLGFIDKTRSSRFQRFCHKIGLNVLPGNEKSEWPVFEVDMPHGGTAMWAPEQMLRDVIRAGAQAWARGKLTVQQDHIGRRCMDMVMSLAGVGLTALIDEATGYQHARAPDALQDIYSRLIRATAADWERRFPREFYTAVCRLWGWGYADHRALPPVIGNVTERFVYLAVFPKEVVDEIKQRKKSQKLHQWLTESDGLRILEKQIADVTVIAKSSVDYRDFEARCTQAFFKPGDQLSIIYPRAA